MSVRIRILLLILVAYLGLYGQTSDISNGTIQIPRSSKDAVTRPSVEASPLSKHFFYVRDHIDSIVQVTDSEGNVVQENFYYPYGMLMGESSDILQANGSTVSGVAARRKRPNAYRFAGKEYLTIGGGAMSDFGGRYCFPTTGRFGQQDIYQENTPQKTPYLYCTGNPLNFIDPDGKDALRIVDEENKTITVEATYYVVTMNRPYKVNEITYYVPGYNESDISNMSSYNEYLNSLNLKVPRGSYEGYSIKFNLSFKATETPGSADIQSKSAITKNEESYGNTIHRGNSFTDPRYQFNIVSVKDEIFSTVAGVTLNHKNIIMNHGFDTKMNIIHEIFHTFGLSHPENGAEDGILHYPPQEPNSTDAYNISVTPFMQTIKR